MKRETTDEVFKRNFIKYMKDKDFDKFKKDFPTLNGVIKLSMDDYGNSTMLSLMANHGMSISLLNNKITELENELRNRNTD